LISPAAPGALIGASDFFELAVATAIGLYGPGRADCTRKVLTTDQPVGIFQYKLNIQI
jgi:ACR3 family arsenite efflux pump ArsB